MNNRIYLFLGKTVNNFFGRVGELEWWSNECRERDSPSAPIFIGVPDAASPETMTQNPHAQYEHMALNHPEFILKIRGGVPAFDAGSGIRTRMLNLSTWPSTMHVCQFHHPGISNV